MSLIRPTLRAAAHQEQSPGPQEELQHGPSPPAYNGTYLCFQLISKVGVIKLYEAEKEGTLLSDAVIFGDLFFHILFQEGHVAEEATSEGSE